MSVNVKAQDNFGDNNNKNGLYNVNDPRRKDLFDDNLDITYKFTRASSSIQAPTFGNNSIAKQWETKAKNALRSFQRKNDSSIHIDSHGQPNNPIMKMMLSETTQETDEMKIAALQDHVLDIVYSKYLNEKLRKPKNRRKRYNQSYDQNNNQNNIRKYDISWYEKCPGPQPHSITRQNLYRLRDYYYWVTEKSDGIRFMFFVCFSHQTKQCEAHLIDRKFQFHQIRHPFYKRHLNDMNGPTLLDGELIINNGKLMYLAFDCMCQSGNLLSTQLASDRIAGVDAFIKKYKCELENHKTSERVKTDGIPPLLLRAKKHLKAADISLLCAQIQKCPITKEYIYDNGTRTTKNDGLIFTPQESNYLMSYDPGALMKWKFLEKNTIDLKVKSPYIWRGKLDLFAGGPSSRDILFTSIEMNAENKNRFDKLHNEMKGLSEERNDFVHSFIVECAFNLESKEWEMLQTRPDKHIPNYITVCMDTLTVMVDDVTKNELIKACTEDKDNQNNVANIAQ